MAVTRSKVLHLYKQLLKESMKFPSYTYRTYALRKIKDEFRFQKQETNSEKISYLFLYAMENLEVIKRQVLVGQMYVSPDLVIQGAAKRS